MDTHKKQLLETLLMSTCKMFSFFLFLHENICYGYSSEVPLSVHNICFYGEIRKYITHSLLKKKKNFISSCVSKTASTANFEIQYVFL